MADMLEHQEGITHVAFNFLLAEICGALQQGLEAEHPEIAGRWGGRTYSRTYVTRLLRELGDKEIFSRDWHQERNEETGRTRRFRTFNLNRSHPLVRETLVSQWGPDTDTIAPEPEASGEEAQETPPAQVTTQVVESVDELEVSANGVEAEAAEEEVPPAPPARPSRRRGPSAPKPPRNRRNLRTRSPSLSGAEESAEEEVPPAPPARPSRRRGRQRPTSEEPAQSSGQVPSQPVAEEPEAEEVPPATPSRAPRRRGRQRPTAEEAPQSLDPASSPPDAVEPEPATAATAEETAQ